MHYGVIFNFGSALAPPLVMSSCEKRVNKLILPKKPKNFVCSPAIFETCFPYNKDIWIAPSDYYVYFYVPYLSV